MTESSASALPRLSSRYAKLAWGTLVFNLLVILWGAFVRATGSGAGCGSHWPLCNGEVVPHSPAVATLIELGHRLTSGIALLLIAALVIGAWRGYPRGHRVRRAAAASGLLILSEALIGAGLVLLELVAHNASAARGFWVAGHLLNTFLLAAALALTAWWASGGAEVHLRRNGGLAAVLGAGLAGLLLLGISGAVTALGDTLFPASSLAEAEAQTFSNTAHVFVRLRIWHPTLAILLAVYVMFAAWRAATDAAATDTTRRLALGLLGLYLLQLVVGSINVGLLAPVGLQLIHLLLADLVWITLVLLTASALAAPPSLATDGRMAERPVFESSPAG